MNSYHLIWKRKNKTAISCGEEGNNMDKSNLGNRMKMYEKQSRQTLMRRNPVIVRLDGKAFSKFTKGMKKPFDAILMKTMQDTMKYLCENIQGCMLGYTQSDEITLLLVDYKNIYSEAWYDNQLQKIVSVSASMATLAFNKSFRENVENTPTTYEEAEVYYNKFDKALFDSRAFSIPKDEVNNCFLWRQLDASKNSVSMVAQANFSHKELQCKNTNMKQEMLFTEKGINWNDLPTTQKRGSCCIRKQVVLNEGTEDECIRNKWIIDQDIPRFNVDRDYVDRFVYINE